MAQKEHKMAKGKTLFETIKSVKEHRNTNGKAVKLMEEVGELAAAILQSQGLKGLGSKTHKQAHTNLLEESCDCIIIILKILSDNGFTYDDMLKMCDTKIEKWKLVSTKIPKWVKNKRTAKK